MSAHVHSDGISAHTAYLVADPPVSGVQRTAMRDTVVSESTKQVVTGETVFVSVIEANVSYDLLSLPTSDQTFFEQKNRLGKPGILGVREHG